MKGSGPGQSSQGWFSPTSMGMLTRRKEPQRFNSRVAFAVSGGLLLY